MQTWPKPFQLWQFSRMESNDFCSERVELCNQRLGSTISGYLTSSTSVSSRVLFFCPGVKTNGDAPCCVWTMFGSKMSQEIQDVNELLSLFFFCCLRDHESHPVLDTRTYVLVRCPQRGRGNEGLLPLHTNKHSESYLISQVDLNLGFKWRQENLFQDVIQGETVNHAQQSHLRWLSMADLRGRSGAGRGVNTWALCLDQSFSRWRLGMTQVPATHFDLKENHLVLPPPLWTGRAPMHLRFVDLIH